jgi:ATP-dependent DNA helicase RecG
MKEMNIDELKNLVRIGEGLTLEFKKSSGSNIGREICAFANARGGRILLGIDDDGRFAGVTNLNKLKSEMQTTARNIDPPLLLDIQTVDDILIVRIPEGKNKPYSVNGKFYIREGANTQQLNRAEIRDFFYKEGLVFFDDRLNSTFDMEKDFSKFMFQRFKRLADIPDGLDRFDILRNLEIVKDNRITNAGILLFGKKVTRFIRSATITCALFHGTTKYKILDSKEFDEDIYTNYDNAMNYLVSHLDTEYIIRGGPREERLELPENALREAIINAIAHRDYRSPANIQVYIFKDRVEIVNPGGLVPGLKLEELGKRSLPRNLLLFDLMHRIDMVEKIGSGFFRMRRALDAYGMGEPILDINGNWFSITFNRTGLEKGFESSMEKTADSHINLTELQREILNRIKDNVHITYSEMETALKKDRTTIIRSVKQLRNMNLIERIGSDKAGHWRVNWDLSKNKPISTQAARSLKLSRLQMMILELIKTNPDITYDELAISLKRGRDTIRLNVNGLKKMNLIERIGSRRMGQWKVKGDALEIIL